MFWLDIVKCYRLDSAGGMYTTAKSNLYIFSV